jgi:hypothetical protein
VAYKQIEVNEEFIQEMALLRQPDKTVGLIEACSKSPVVFSEYMLGLKLYSWQVHFIHKLMRACEDRTLTREYVAITSRQIGKSTVLAVFSLWACIYNKYPGTIHNGTIVGIVSATDQQARTLLLNINKFIISGDGFMKETYPGKFGDKFFSALLDNTAPNNTTTITFKKWNEATHGKLLLAGSKAGSTIQSFPPTSVVLGYTFTLILVDEVGMTEKIDDMFLISYLFPTGNSTNAIRVYTSTPWGADGYFYRLVDPEGLYEVSPADITMFTIDAIKLEAPKYYETVMKDIERMNSDGNIDDVQRSYYCRFVKGQSAYFNPDNVRTMFDTTYTMYTMYAGKCDMGVDFGGQVKSKTVITISELTSKGIVRRLYHRVYPVGKDITLLDDIAALKLQFNVQRIIPDDCPAGQYIIRIMKDDKGWDVFPMNFRSDKVAKYGAFRSWLNKGKITSYPDTILQTEMLALEFNNGSRNSMIEHAPGYSDDLIDSFLMSTYFFVEDEGRVKVFDIDEVEDEDYHGMCPKCESVKFQRTEKKDALHKRCLECNHEWSEKYGLYD